MYFLDVATQHSVLAGLTLIEQNDSEWVRIYKDSAGNEWTMYHPFSSRHGGGQPYLRRGPVPDKNTEVADWVVQLLRSGREDDASGAAADLAYRHETWSMVLDMLEAEYDTLCPHVVYVFIDQLGILAPLNRRAIAGKPYAEVKKDAAHFTSLATRAARLHTNG